MKKNKIIDAIKVLYSNSSKITMETVAEYIGITYYEIFSNEQLKQFYMEEKECFFQNKFNNNEI